MERRRENLVIASVLVLTLAVVVFRGGQRLTGSAAAPGSFVVADDADGQHVFLTSGQRWNKMEGQGYRNGYTLHRHTIWTGTNVGARWFFRNLTPGTYEIFVTWPAVLGMSDKLSYRVDDGTTTPLIVQSFSQQHPPASDVRWEGSDWQRIGSAAITSGNIVSVSLLAKNRETFVADAVRLVLREVASVSSSSSSSSSIISSRSSARSSSSYAGHRRRIPPKQTRFPYPAS
ncbi:TPA: hypothetical protein DCL30_01090 [Candidatus Peribacteria bacterium]|nr:MAG: hypothetical protein A3J91_03110 [Candidatus Peribacteria bacterium RIFOXYC2_FULL_58_10]OGJ85140.1 MAG: hypothetical protein A2529_01600 [Candidatus Peribacteria bacterium RIFOXYD2_FULL_58_15]HAI98123.1 hypothetical protein [Candidatus Peribacteria bacterium]HAS33836.1 hypothetical protein [Candidatus Peribacteria bacterium]